MRHDIVAFSEPSRICYLRMEGSIVPPCNDGCEGGVAIQDVSHALLRVGRRGEIFPRYPDRSSVNALAFNIQHSLKTRKPCYLSQTAGLHRFLILFKDYNTATFFTGSGFSGAKIRRKTGKIRENQRNSEKNQRNSEKFGEIRIKIG